MRYCRIHNMDYLIECPPCAESRNRDELLHRLKNIQDAELSTALAITDKLRRSEAVSDGDLLDALYAFAVRLDIASPLLPVCHETLKRFMVYSGITETPRGIQRSWLESYSNPNCIDGKISMGCAVDGPLLTVDCPDCSRSTKIPTIK
jgi:hypothetical protein